MSDKTLIEEILLCKIDDETWIVNKSEPSYVAISVKLYSDGSSECQTLHRSGVKVRLVDY